MAQEPKRETLDYSVDAFNDFATLARLFVKLGGDVSEIAKPREVWFHVKVNFRTAHGAGQHCDVIEPGEGLFRAAAALAGKIEKQLIERAERHRS